MIAGGSGFIGAALGEALRRRNWDVVVLTRSPECYCGEGRAIGWDGRSIGDWAIELDGAEAIVNLAGKNINGRPTQSLREAVLSSRVDSVRVIGEALEDCKRRPHVWVQASALGVYGDTGDGVCREDTPFSNGYPADVCVAWEGAFEEVVPKGMRQVVLRIGFALGRSGGALPFLARLARWGLGGAAGNGRQWVSWIHIEDLIRIFLLAIEMKGVSGGYNAVGPNPAKNHELMQALRRASGSIWSPFIPAFAVRFGCWILGSDADLALVSHRCLPGRLIVGGFDFKFSNLDEALDDLFARTSG